MDLKTHADGFSQSQAHVFQEFVEKLMDEYQAPGVAVGVISNGKTVYLKGFGYRDLEKKLPVTENTVFGIASVTKSFTALAIQQLAEEGKVSTSDPVKRHLHEFELPQEGIADKVTVHHFLTHTSGIPPLPSLGYAIAESSREQARKEEKTFSAEEARVRDSASHPSVATDLALMEFLSTYDYELLGLPGQYMSYSNECYGLLGTIIQRASGLSYEDYLRENILSPLGMKSTTTLVEKIKDYPDVTKLYYKDDADNLKTAARWQEAPAFTACGFLKSNVLDLLEYLKMYLNRGRHGRKRIISTLGVSSMVTPYCLSGRGVWYGYGFNIRPGYGRDYGLNDGRGVTLVQHSGSLRGVAANIGFVPEKNIGAVVLCNLSGFPSSKVWLGAINLLLGLPVDHPLVRVPTSEQPEWVLRKIAGEYRSGEGEVFKFHVDGDKLVMEIDSKFYPVRMTGPDSAAVTIKATENHMSFFYDHEGSVWALNYGLRVIRKTK